jgi:diguanylate cyclase (GGDEF)-like protein/PAS domain S-box-containing protein
MAFTATYGELCTVTVFQSIRRKFFAREADLADIGQWRERVLSAILFVVVVLGAVTAVPSILLALSEGLWPIAVIDAVALIWITTIWRVRSLSFQARVWNFLALLYLLGCWFLVTLGPVSQIYLMAFPVMAGLLLGLRPAWFGLVLNAATLLGVGYLANIDLQLPGFEAQPFLRWTVITINFTFVSSVITISGAVLLQRLEKSLERQRTVTLSLEEQQAHLRALNKELWLTAAAVSRLNEIVLIMEAGLPTNPEPRVVFANVAFERRTGYSREEVLGRAPHILQGPNTQRSELDRIRSAFQKWEPVRAELINYTKSGEEFWLELDIVPIADETGHFTHWVAVGWDITERKKAEAHIHRLAFFDALTGLPNRRLLLDRIGLLLANVRRSKMVSAVLFIDLDHFKYINDARGHAVGDSLLKHVAMQLSNVLREADTVARIGGDEFVVLISALAEDVNAGALAAMAVAEKVRDAIAQPFDFEGQPYSPHGSIGVTLLTKEEQTADDLLREADMAMYQAKAAGRNRIAFFESTMQSEVEKRLTMERDLAQAIVTEQLEMYLQPQVNHAGHPVGAELLIRWTHPVYGPVSPATFIPFAEESGIIVRLGEWILRQACSMLLRLAEAGRPLPLSINVSPRQFRQTDFVDRVRAVLTETGASASQLIFEVTEGLLIENLEDTIARMHELSTLGIRFSIDDFGTGYSSLSYLKKLPLYELKIDKSFVQETPNDPNDTAIVQSILSMAKHLGLRVVAEGVETREQADFLVASGCDCLQGYLFARPMPISEWLNQ